MVWSLVGGLAKSIVGGVKDHFEDKRKLKKAKTDAKIQRLQSKQDHKQKWEIKQLENTGWKDDILFYFFLAMFVWAGFYPEMSQEFFTNIQKLPEWFIKTWMWLVASVLGVKKIGDYGPQAVKSMKDAFEKGTEAVSEATSGKTEDASREESAEVESQQKHIYSEPKRGHKE